MNHLPPPEKQTGNQMVSKSEYVKAQGKRATVGVLAIGLGGLTALCGVVTLDSLIACPAESLGWWGKNTGIEEMLNLGVMLLFGAGTSIFRRLANNTMKVAANINPGVPLTRANAADLPTPDSQVRASAEPVQEPQAVLLRATTETAERHEEQLVRPVGGGEQI